MRDSKLDCNIIMVLKDLIIIERGAHFEAYSERELGMMQNKK